MKTLKLNHELTQIIFVLLPFLYLFYIWKELPDEVPIHWNFKGEIDRYGSKLELILIPILLPLLMYIIMWIVPIIDPKGKIKDMGDKYDHLKILIVGSTSILAITILHFTKNETIIHLKYLFLLVGILYMIMGNYFKTIRPNYFMGIRTPWTLENETVWKKTHRMAGVLWLIGGVVVVLFSLFMKNQPLRIGFILVTAILVLIPVGFSYMINRKLKNIS